MSNGKNGWVQFFLAVGTLASTMISLDHCQRRDIREIQNTTQIQIQEMQNEFKRVHERLDAIYTRMDQVQQRMDWVQIDMRTYVRKE